MIAWVQHSVCLQRLEQVDHRACRPLGSEQMKLALRRLPAEDDPVQVLIHNRLGYREYPGGIGIIVSLNGVYKLEGYLIGVQPQPGFGVFKRSLEEAAQRQNLRALLQKQRLKKKAHKRK